MDRDTTTVRRPVALCVIVVLYSALILLNVVVHSYLRFWSSHRSSVAAACEGWTVLDYRWRFHPALLALAGCIGLAMLKRWALYAFGILVTLRLWEAVRLLLAREAEELAEMFVWLPQLFAIAPPAIALLYALHLARKGMLGHIGRWSKGCHR